MELPSFADRPRLDRHVCELPPGFLRFALMWTIGSAMSEFDAFPTVMLPLGPSTHCLDMSAKRTRTWSRSGHVIDARR
jgi:hypothetical protein